MMKPPEWEFLCIGGFLIGQRFCPGDIDLRARNSGFASCTLLSEQGYKIICAVDERQEECSAHFAHSRRSQVYQHAEIGPRA